MKTVIISGGNIDDDFALSFLKNEIYDKLIAVDKGLEFCKRADLYPDEILGDFDSVNQNVKQYFDRLQIPTLTFHPVKDSTDMEIAMNEALCMGSSEIIILGGTGSRLDHVLGSIKNLSIAMKAGVKAQIVDKHNRILMTDEAVTIKKKEQYGKYVSLHAVGGNVKGLTLKGFFYNLENFDLDAFSALGVSNEIVDDVATISFESGILCVIESKD